MAPRGRPRGSGRGGAKAPERQAQKAAESELSAPPAENSEAVPDAASVADPKQGKESLNADHDMPDAQLQASAEQADQPLATSASTSAFTSTRPAVQRLDSLRGISAPSSRSASPATRGAAAARGRKPLSRQPVFKGRRSKEERDALQQEALERERERRAEREAEIRKTNRGLYRGAGGRGRGDRAGRGRGGYMGDVPVSGPFSLGKVTNDPTRRTNHSQSIFSGGGSGSGGARIKKEPNSKRDEDDDLNKSLGIYVKKEVQDGGYISSDEDEVTLGPRKDVDNILEISDDDDDAEEGSASRQKERNPPALIPIRISRREHHDRVIGINTEASSAASAKILKQAEKNGGSSTAEAVEAVTRKGKAKIKDIEITEVRRPYKGMWQETDDQEGVVKIKDEPVDEDGAITVPEEVAVGAGDSTQNEALKQPLSSAELGKKSLHKGRGRQRRRLSMRDSTPSLQTEEERQEWARHQFDLSEIRRELGQTDTPTVAAPTTATEDTDGDTAMKEGQPQPVDMKADRVYLFQLPPIVPDLLLPTVKKELPDEADPIITATDQTPVKIEDGEAKPTLKDPLSTSSEPSLASGRVGKLRVHESGRATLSWGGTSLELCMGMSPHFLQDTVVTRITPPEERVGPGDEGEALGFGQVRGKFVVTPDWYEIVG